MIHTVHTLHARTPVGRTITAAAAYMGSSVVITQYDVYSTNRRDADRTHFSLAINNFLHFRPTPAICPSSSRCFAANQYKLIGRPLRRFLATEYHICHIVEAYSFILPKKRLISAKKNEKNITNIQADPITEIIKRLVHLVARNMRSVGAVPVQCGHSKNMSAEVSTTQNCYITYWRYSFSQNRSMRATAVGPNGKIQSGLEGAL